jgi:hypothetical protein
VPITKEFHEFCRSTILGTLDDRKAPYWPKSLHIFIVSKIRHSHIQYDMRKWCGIKHRLNWAKVWPAYHMTLASRPCVGTFLKTIFTTCQRKSVRGVPMWESHYKEETWPPSQVAWPTGLSSGPHAPNLQPQHHLTPPINTMVLPPVESVKRVRFSRL